MLEPIQTPDTITFETEAFDWFMVQIVKREMLTPDMGEILNYLLEHQVHPDV